MSPDVFVRRGGADDCVDEAAAGAGGDFGGSGLATTAFSALGGATFTGVAGFDCVVALAGAVVAVSTFVGALATASAFTGAVTLVGAAGGAGCDATVFGLVDCAVTACD